MVRFSLQVWRRAPTSGAARLGAQGGAFAALKAGGRVVAWGQADAGGDASAVQAELAAGVTALAATSGAFAALKEGGRVVRSSLQV